MLMEDNWEPEICRYIEVSIIEGCPLSGVPLYS